MAWLSCGVALFAALAACQLIAGVESRQVDPILSGCTFPSGAGPQVRVANFVPTSDVVDICIRAAGTDWGRPLVRDGGTGCAALLPADANKNPGFAYSDVSVAFTAPASVVDVKLIAAGSTCGANALTEADGVTLPSNAITTFLRIGGNGVPQKIVALPEADKADPSSTRLRFVHAMPGVGPLDFGTAAGNQLPTTVSSPIVQPPIAFGTTSGPNSTTVLGVFEDNGYVAFPDTMLTLAANVDGVSQKAILLQSVPAQNDTYSFYAIGVAGDNLHPQRSLLCQEDVITPGDAGVVKLLETCTPGALPSLSIEVFNPALYGPSAPYEDQRRPVNGTALQQAIAATGADVMCMVEVDRLEDRQAIVNDTGVKAAFPNNFMITTDLTTPFTDPTDQTGQVPPASTTPPCGSGVNSADVDAAFMCMEQYCSTKPNDPTGELLATTDCLSTNCAEPLLNVKGESTACYDCIINYVAAQEPWGSTESTCETNPAPPVAFDGQNSTMILSRYPLLNTDSFILPSTNYRRSILYAQVQLEDQMIDFYCGFLITPIIATDLPFVGPYGGGADAGLSSQEEYDNEQLLEAQKLVAWVQKKSGSGSNANHAILMGDWRSSVMAGTSTSTISAPQDLNPQTIMTMTSAGFVAASAPSFPPQCNFCPTAQNPYNGDDSYFVEQPFLYNWPSATTAVLDESILFTNNSAITLPNGAGTGPLSQYYGLGITVARP